MVKDRLVNRLDMKKAVLFILILGLFLCFGTLAMADTNIILLPDTTHTYTGGTGSLSIDGDFNTIQYQSAGGDYDSNAVVTSTHTFAIPRTITSIKFRMSAHAHVYGDSDQVADIHYNVQYYDSNGWHVITNSQYNSSSGGNTTVDHDSGTVSLPVNLTSVTAIKAMANGHTHSGGNSRTEDSSASIYEIQAYGVVDIGLRAYDGTNVIKIACEPTGTLTSPLRISKNSTIYAVTLVDPTDANASKIRVKTSSGIKALKKY